MSITRHPLWPALRPYFRIEKYARDGGHSHPRSRIEIRPLPHDLLGPALDLTMPCVVCGASIHPIRARQAAPKRGKQAPHLYYAPCCPLAVNIGCSRSPAASGEYEAVIQAVA